MKLGLMVGASDGPQATLEGLVAFAQRVEAAGFDRLSLAHIFGLDAMTALAIAGQKTERIELGTAVVPTFPRHPVAMAQQALTVQAACRGRFTLGVGLSHRVVIEDMLGLSFEKPAGHMEEYLSVLGPLLRGEAVDYQGQRYRANVQLQIRAASPLPLLVAALGPQMLRIAGRLADGTFTWMTGPRTLAEHVVPTLTAAAREAGRGGPRIVAGVPVVVTDQAGAVRDAIAQPLAIYGQLPSYRAMLDREGVGGPVDLALLGNEAEVRRGIERYRQAGVTDLALAILATEEGAFERTLGFLGSLV